MYCCICFLLGLKHTFPFNNKHRATHNGAELQIDTYMICTRFPRVPGVRVNHRIVTSPPGNHHRRGILVYYQACLQRKHYVLAAYNRD